MRGFTAVKNTNGGDDRKSVKQSCYDGLERNAERGDKETIDALRRFKRKPYYSVYKERYN